MLFLNGGSFVLSICGTGLPRTLLDYAPLSLSSSCNTDPYYLVDYLVLENTTCLLRRPFKNEI